MINMENIDLSKFVPFELYIDKKTSLIKRAGDIELNYNVRKLFDMKEVIYDNQWLKNQKNNFDLYYMYRDLTRDNDKELFQNHKIRFDVTIIPANFLGKEFVKTAGHFHPEAKEGYSFPEVYEVMHGEGLYLLQNNISKNNEIEIILISAKAGDQVLIPPGYGHITINPSKTETLVMNNLVSSQFSSIYEPIKNHAGAAYIYLKDGSWNKNPTYKNELLIKEKTPAKIVDKPFYLSFLENPDEWVFLNEPWKREEW